MPISYIIWLLQLPALWIDVYLVLISLACLYTEDLKVAAMASIVLKIMALAQPGQSTQLSLAGVLREREILCFHYIHLLPAFGFSCGSCLYFCKCFPLGLIGAWVALVLDQYTRAAIVYFRYASGNGSMLRQETKRLRR